MKAKLVVVGGDAKAGEVNLRLPTVVGRGRDVTLTLPHPLVSRRHCEIYESDGQLFVRDLGSLNGTFVGNERITEAALPPGELLTIGSVTFRAVYESNGVVPAPHKSPKGSDTIYSPEIKTQKEHPPAARGVPDFTSIDAPSSKSANGGDDEYEEVELPIDEIDDDDLAEFAAPLLGDDEDESDADDPNLAPPSTNKADPPTTPVTPPASQSQPAENDSDDDDLQSFFKKLT